MTKAEREAWERGVSDCASLIVQNTALEHDRERIMALALGLMHGTLGPGPQPHPR